MFSAVGIIFLIALFHIFHKKNFIRKEIYLLLLWFFFFLGMAILMPYKEDRFIIPIIPAIALISGYFIDKIKKYKRIILIAIIIISLLSLSVKAFGTPKYCFTVPRGAFRPAPNVDSAVLSIENIRRDAFSTPEDENVFFEVLRAGFSQKRKRLAKNLEQLYPSESIVRAFQTLGLSPNVRSEDIGEEVWWSLVHTLRI